MTNNRTNVVIVGGGNVGASAGYYLSKLGMKVIIIERDAVGNHASGFAYGALSPLGGVGIPGPILPMSIEAMKVHLKLNDSLKTETNIDTHFQLKPTLTLAFNDDEENDLKGEFSWQQAQQGYKVDWLDRKAIDRVEPRVSHDALGGVYTQGTAEVDPYRLVLALTHAAEKHGAEYKHGEVIGLEKKSGRSFVIKLKSGELRCDHVVLAMGPWTGFASDWLGLKIPIGPLKGQILRLKAPGLPLKVTVSGSGSYATTKPDGLLWAGTTEEEVGFNESLTSEARDYIMNALLKMIPSMEDAELVTQTACLRPVSKDELLLLGRVPGWEGVYVATGAGRKGILLGPLMAQVVVDMIHGNPVSVPIEPFAVERFQTV